MSVAKIVVHTDVILDHLCGDKYPSVLRRAMGKFFCYATVFQAIELFSYARIEVERKAIEDAMAAMKLLGLNPKNAQRYGKLLRSTPRSATLNILVAGLCLESRLPILTGRKKDFAGVKGLEIVSPEMTEGSATGAEILQSIRQSRKRK